MPRKQAIAILQIIFRKGPHRIVACFKMNYFRTATSLSACFNISRRVVRWERRSSLGVSFQHRGGQQSGAFGMPAQERFAVSPRSRQTVLREAAGSGFVCP